MLRILKPEFWGDLIIGFLKNQFFPLFLYVVQPPKLCSKKGNDFDFWWEKTKTKNILSYVHMICWKKTAEWWGLQVKKSSLSLDILPGQWRTCRVFSWAIWTPEYGPSAWSPPRWRTSPLTSWSIQVVHTGQMSSKGSTLIFFFLKSNKLGGGGGGRAERGTSAEGPVFSGPYLPFEEII